MDSSSDPCISIEPVVMTLWSVDDTGVVLIIGSIIELTEVVSDRLFIEKLVNRVVGCDDGNVGKKVGDKDGMIEGGVVGESVAVKKYT